MSNKILKNEASFEAWKSESARQRWQLFHRAIAHAKQSNTDAMEEADKSRDQGDAGRDGTTGSSRSDPLLSIAR